MDRLVPRHRRKAGSGPPANALIAWVGADPYLREAAATASHRRAMALPPPSHTRAAKAAIAACFVLTCGAVLGVTTIINHGRNAALYEISTPLPRQEGAGTPARDSSEIFQAEAGSDPAPAVVPVGVAPALSERSASRPRTAADPVTPEDIDQPADAPPKPSDANADKPVDAGAPAGAGKLTGPNIPNNPGTTANPTKPTVLSRRTVPTIGGEPPQRSADRPAADVVHERRARAHEFFQKFHVGTATPPR